LIYAVGPEADGNRTAPRRSWPASFRLALAAVVMLAVGFGSGVMAIWLVLTPIIPMGAAGEVMGQPFPSHVGQTTPGQHGAAPAVVAPVEAPPAIEEERLVTRGPGRTSVVVDQRRSAIKKSPAPTPNRPVHRLRCAHNAASVR
jgi:hypothetical protein